MSLGYESFCPNGKLLWQLPTTSNLVLELKYAYEDNNYNNSYAGQSTADFNANPHQQYVAHQLGEYNTEHHTSYVKLRYDMNSNITNNLTGYFNYFTRDWFKLTKLWLVELNMLKNVLTRKLLPATKL